MDKKSRKSISIVVIGILLLIIVSIGGHLFSIGIGSASTYAFIYVNTYNYPNMTQEPAAVVWSFSDSAGSASGSCNTQVEEFNLGSSLQQLNAPYSSGQVASVPQYAYSGDSNIAVCEIVLPSSVLNEYNTESGTFTASAIGKNNLKSSQYSATLNLQSIYEGQSNNAASPILITIPLVAPNSSTTSTTSTISTTTSTIIATNDSTSPPVQKDNTSFFGTIQNSIQSFINNILSSISHYFNVPSNLFSISYSGVNSKNITTVGTKINVSVIESIPNQYLSNKWSTGINKVVQTYCGSYVYYNSTEAYVYESPVINMTTANYSNSFSFIPTAVGIYVLGSSCLTSNTTYANGVWSNWTTPSIIYQQNKAIAVVSKNTSVAAPVTSVNISNGFFGSISHDISSFIDGILKFFTNL